MFKPHLNEQGWVGVAFLGIIALFFLAYNFYLILKYRKRVRYAEVFEDLNIGFSGLHKVNRNGEADMDTLIKKVMALSSSLSDVFTKVYGHHIGVCVKIIFFKKDRALAQTLARDKKSLTKDRKTGSKDKGEHWLDKNSDFNFIYVNYDNDNEDTSFYHKTWLPLKKDYQNTRLKKWPPKKTTWLLDDVVRLKHWPLKYRSTLVVPIVPLLSDDQNQKAVRGFLCLDSPRMRCFNKEVDTEILKGVADGLYSTIDKLAKLNTYE